MKNRELAYIKKLNRVILTSFLVCGFSSAHALSCYPMGSKIAVTMIGGWISVSIPSISFVPSLTSIPARLSMSHAGTTMIYNFSGIKASIMSTQGSTLVYTANNMQLALSTYDLSQATDLYGTNQPFSVPVIHSCSI